jgi:hypothetical protein
LATLASKHLITFQCFVAPVAALLTFASRVSKKSFQRTEREKEFFFLPKNEKSVCDQYLPSEKLKSIEKYVCSVLHPFQLNYAVADFKHIKERHTLTDSPPV